jgi:hypothetical protein
VEIRYRKVKVNVKLEVKAKFSVFFNFSPRPEGV